MANIEFKGFKLIYANGNSIAKVLASEATAPDTLYLVRTNANGNDGYFVLNGKVYGSGLNTKDYAEGYVQGYVSDMINRLNKTVETSGTKYISGTIVEEKGELKSFAINEDKLDTKFTQIDNAITAITGDTGTIYDKINTAIGGLDATIKTESGCTLPITIAQENGKLTSVEITTFELDNAIEDIDSIKTDFNKFKGDTANGFSAVNQRINNLDATVSGTSTNSPITVKVEQVDGKLTGVTVTDTLGTGAKADVLATGSTISGATGVDNNLVSVKQVTDYVTDRVANLTGAMHFEGVKEVVPSDNTGYESGDVILVGTKEYVYDGKNWVELGDEGIYLTTANAETYYVKKTTTIAGADLQDNITAEELRTALNVANGAQVNVLEGVKVNGTKLGITNKEVDITVTSGTTNGTISVNGANVAVTGLKSAAYQDDTYFDKAGTAAKAIAEISGTTTGTASTNYGITVTTTQANGKVTGITVNDSALKTEIDGIDTKITNLGNEAVKEVNGMRPGTGNTITLTGKDIAVGEDVDGDGTMTSGSTVSTVLEDIYTKLNTANANAYTGITAADNTVTVSGTTHGHSVAVKLKTLKPDEMASGLIQLVSDKDGIYGKLFYDGVEKEMNAPTVN